MSTLAFAHVVGGQATYIFYDEGTAGRMLTADELPTQDKMAIYHWAMEGSNKLTSFRRKEKEPLEPAFTGNGVRAKTK